MTDAELDSIALNRGNALLGGVCHIISSTREGVLPSIKYSLETDDGRASMTLWLNTDTGEIDDEDVD